MRNKYSLCFSIQIVLLASLIGHSTCLMKPGPRIDEKAKYHAQVPDFKSSKQPSDEFDYAGDKSQGEINNSSGTNYIDQNKSYEYEEERRIVISEPYRSLIQTSARFAVAQTSVTNYINIETFMNLINDAGYALSKPSTLLTALKAVAVVLGTLMASAFFIPSSLIKMLDINLRQPERLMSLERYLPDGLNEMGIIGLLNEKTEELLSRLALNDSSCREQSVCQAGEMIRCTFPKFSKTAISFISENFSRPKYRSNKYLNAFLVGFIDQNCAESVNQDNQQSNCAGNFIKSLAFCPQRKRSNGPVPANQPKAEYQTIRAARA